MARKSDAERDPDKRCRGAYRQRPGRTHLCRLTADHPTDKHACICSATWPTAKPRETRTP
ncbi:hypothetical protein [Agromyces sp. SYSU T00194]|uniref:hypothetical protein n=1 Tax=Agromyces chitinivorans TaxID=3158560 RepID=UPI003391DD64